MVVSFFFCFLLALALGFGGVFPSSVLRVMLMNVWGLGF
jgi:hypothetical protein